MAAALEAARSGQPVEPPLLRWAQAHVARDTQRAAAEAALKPLEEERRDAYRELEFAVDADFAQFVKDERNRW